MKKLLFVLLTIFVVTTLMSCGSDDIIDNPDPTVCPVTYSYADGDSWESTEEKPAARSAFEAIPLNEDEREIIEGRNDFALAVFRELSKGSENMLFSPISLSMNLSMLSNGASESTLDELIKVSRSGEASNSLDKKLIDGLISADKTSRISIANSIWFDHSVDVLNDFVNDNCTNYYAGIFRRELSAEATMDEINSWTERNT